MRLLTLSAVALASKVAHGYLDTSPFFMFSNSEMLSPSTSLQSAATITTEISKSLSQCHSQFYIIVNQAGVTGEDYRSKKATPFLAQKLSQKSNSGIRSSVIISEVQCDVDSAVWREALEAECKMQSLDIDASSGSIPAMHKTLPKLWNVFLPAPAHSSKEQRYRDMYQNDAFIASVLDGLPSENYTVLYTTTPKRTPSRKHTSSEGKAYDMESEIQNLLHMDLKRDIGDVSQAAKSKNQTLVDGPLFDRYQFFTPGIFMGFFVGFLLLLILYVGISGLASLQVSYAAFDKETGALSAKKQQ